MHCFCRLLFSRTSYWSRAKVLHEKCLALTRNMELSDHSCPKWPINVSHLTFGASCARIKWDRLIMIRLSTNGKWSCITHSFHSSHVLFVLSTVICSSSSYWYCGSFLQLRIRCQDVKGWASYMSSSALQSYFFIVLFFFGKWLHILQKSSQACIVIRISTQNALAFAFSPRYFAFICSTSLRYYVINYAFSDILCI